MDIPGDMSKASFNAPTQVVEVDATAMAATPADIRELPASYVFVVDMPGLEPGEIKVQVEYGNLLVISGEGRQEDDDEGKYLHMERQVRKFMCKFLLSHNANTDAISAVCWNGVLTVTVEKLQSSPPPPPPKTIEVKFA